MLAGCCGSREAATVMENIWKAESLVERGEVNPVRVKKKPSVRMRNCPILKRVI